MNTVTIHIMYIHLPEKFEIQTFNVLFSKSPELFHFNSIQSGFISEIVKLTKTFIINTEKF